MERKGGGILAAALLPGVLCLSGCEGVLAGLSAWETYIVVYCTVAIAVLLWLLWRVKTGTRRSKKQPPPALVAAPTPAPAPKPAPAPAPQPATPAPQPRTRERMPVFGNPWWDIPAGTYIFIDTCVLMEACRDQVVSAWFQHLRKFASTQDWSIVILNSVIRELDGLKNSDNEERAQASRAATNLLAELQRALGQRFIITGANRTPADDEFEREMQEGDLLCTRDNNLALRINGVQGLRALGLMDFPRIHQRQHR